MADQNGNLQGMCGNLQILLMQYILEGIKEDF